jgi:glutamine amidotransferase
MNHKILVAIVDYKIGNLFSVQNALKHLELDSVITSDAEEIRKADALILPGVGAFGDAMNNLKGLGLIKPIKEFVDSGKPFMGICLGLQLLFSESEEFGTNKGLDIIKGNVVKFKQSGFNHNFTKVPQISWNQIYSKNIYWDATELKGIQNGEYMYFVHSFYVVPENPSHVLSVTYYEGFEYCSSIKMNNVFACQFHPEKSGRKGMRILKNFKDIICK